MKKILGLTSLVLICLSSGLVARGGGDALAGGLVGGMAGGMLGSTIAAPRGGGGESRSSDSHKTRKLKERIEECEQDISSLEKSVKKLAAEKDALEDRVEALEKKINKITAVTTTAEKD